LNKKNLMLKKLFITCIVFFFLSCGVEEHYFLPQVQANSITSTIYNASIRIPPIPDDPFYYASYYAIFYRIYTSNYNTQSSSEYSLISPSLLSDYNYFLPISNPANMSTTVSANTFKSRNFFELEFEGKSNVDMLPKTGGTLSIDFPSAKGEYPTASFDSLAGAKLLRSRELVSPKPSDKLFLNSSELLDVSNATADFNADVAGQSGADISYTAMYIAAVGIHPTSFTRIYSKPTLIGVFKLP